MTVAIPSGTTIQGVVTLLGAPASGLGSVVTPLDLGDVIDLFVTRDDTGAQAALAAVENGDGLHDILLRDETLTSIAQRQARGDADLVRYSTAIRTLTFMAQDASIWAGRTATLALAAPTSLSGSLLIQTVTITRFDPMAASWRAVLADNPTNARPIVSSLLKGRVSFEPLERNRWRVRGEGHLIGLFSREVTGRDGVPKHSELEPDSLLP